MQSTLSILHSPLLCPLHCQMRHLDRTPCSPISLNCSGRKYRSAQSIAANINPFPFCKVVIWVLTCFRECLLNPGTGKGKISSSMRLMGGAEHMHTIHFRIRLARARQPAGRGRRYSPASIAFEPVCFWPTIFVSVIRRQHGIFERNRNSQ